MTSFGDCPLLSWSVADASAADLYLIEYNLASE
jgi:hypothetical protein